VVTGVTAPPVKSNLVFGSHESRASEGTLFEFLHFEAGCTAFCLVKRLTFPLSNPGNQTTGWKPVPRLTAAAESRHRASFRSIGGRGVPRDGLGAWVGVRVVAYLRHGTVCCGWVIWWFVIEDDLRYRGGHG